MVTLAVGNQKTSQTFTVEKDPRIKATQQDLDAQLTLLKQVHDKLDKTNKAINRIRSVRSQINTYLEQLKDYPQIDQLKKQAKPILDTLKTVEDNLIQVKSHASEDPLNYPIKLNNKLAALASTIGSSYNRPTKQEYDVFHMLSDKVDAQLKRLQPVFDEKVPAFNNTVKGLSVPAVYLKKDK